jgi:hypothetical protein
LADRSRLSSAAKPVLCVCRQRCCAPPCVVQTVHTHVWITLVGALTRPIHPSCFAKHSLVLGVTSGCGVDQLDAHASRSITCFDQSGRRHRVPGSSLSLPSILILVVESASLSGRLVIPIADRSPPVVFRRRRRRGRNFKN